MSFLEVENLALVKDRRKVLADISFSLEKGSFTLVAGRNGSGKSMLLKALKGLEKPSGSIRLEGMEMDKRSVRMRSFGLVFQDTSLQIVGHTVERDIAFGLENLKLGRDEIRKRTDEMLALFSLEKKRDANPSCLSGGERRRLSIASVLAMEPEVLLLDEPLANLDWPSVRMVLSSLVELRKKGTTILMVSHEAEKFLALTDNTIVIRDGRIAAKGISETMMDALRENDVYLPPCRSFGELSWLS